MGKNLWFVARTHARREKWAAENVVRQGFDYYLPKMAEPVRINGRLELRSKFLFPSYIFVLTDGRWRFMLSTFGMLGVVMIGQGPATISENIIAELKKKENEDGLIILPKRPAYLEKFKSGQRVRVPSGPFSGYVGIYQGATDAERRHVLLEYMSRKIKVLIGDEVLEPVF